MHPYSAELLALALYMIIDIVTLHFGIFCVDALFTHAGTDDRTRRHGDDDRAEEELAYKTSNRGLYYATM